MKRSILIIVVAFFSCRSAAPVIVNNYSGSLVIDGKTFATAFQQRAAEYKALCYQAYNTAAVSIDKIKNQETSLPKAIMTDIDETVLDNSPYQAQQLLKGRDYDPDSWYEWTKKGIADTVPGALRFFQYAAKEGIDIFYVSNRNENELEGTLKNLKTFGFPNADEAHILLRKDVSSKEERRKTISLTHAIVMQIGDNLNDLSAAFEKRTTDVRMKTADDKNESFGVELIVLPNPVYGDWENALYNYNYKLTEKQKDSVIRAVLKH